MEKDPIQKSIVLYVDDIQANLMLFEASFEESYEILLAESGKDALGILKEKEVHVIVSDQNMPGMTGNELLEVVTLEYPDVMRFMITAYTDYETVVEAINKGHLYGFFNKPYNFDDVKHSIDNSLEVRNLRIKNREMISKLEKVNELMLGQDRSKTRFLTSVTEEIRTPINKIMTAVHMIKDKIDSKELTELLDLLDVSVRRLEGFSDAAKHMAKLNNQDFKLNANLVPLHEIIEVGIIERANILNNEQMSVSIDETSVEYSIAGEYDMLQASFSSLLGFVVDHTKKGSEINVGIQNMSDGVKLFIVSHGSSYSEKEKEDLRTLSAQEESFAEKDFSLELVLANQVMKAHKGRLEFTEEGNVSGVRMIFPI
jgi:response regulator RpfG family c-di-GMP phosphodiesterase